MWRAVSKFGGGGVSHAQPHKAGAPPSTEPQPQITLNAIKELRDGAAGNQGAPRPSTAATASLRIPAGKFYDKLATPGWTRPTVASATKTKRACVGCATSQAHEAVDRNDTAHGRAPPPAPTATPAPPNPKPHGPWPQAPNPCPPPTLYCARSTMALVTATCKHRLCLPPHSAAHAGYARGQTLCRCPSRTTGPARQQSAATGAQPHTHATHALSAAHPLVWCTR